MFDMTIDQEHGIYVFHHVLSLISGFRCFLLSTRMLVVCEWLRKTSFKDRTSLREVPVVRSPEVRRIDYWFNMIQCSRWSR